MSIPLSPSATNRHADGERPARETAPARRLPRVAVWLLAVVALILAGWALRALAVVVVPFVLALFVALAVLPVDRWVAAHVPRRLAFLGHVAALLVVVLVLSGFFAGIYVAAQQAVRQLPDISAAFGPSLTVPAADPAAGVAATPPPVGAPAVGSPFTSDGSGSFFSRLDYEALYRRAVSYASDHAGALAAGILNAAASLVAGLVLVIFLTLLMLIERHTWQAKAETLFSRRGQKHWRDTFAKTAESFRWYIVVRTALGLVSGVLYAGWLAIFGVDLLIVWFVLAFLLNYIPTIGSILAAALPVLYVFVVHDWETALIVAAGLIVIEQVLGNYVDPLVQGRQLSVSPVVSFLALLLFGWMWGIIGALLAMPIVVFAVIALAHVEALKPVALILSDAGDMKSLEEKTYR
jgi:AI-2 transport protein TqsA